LYPTQLCFLIPAPSPKVKAKKAKAGAKKGAGKKAAGTKKKKDPNAPKRGMSAYMFYMNGNRATIREENPDATFGDIGKIAGAQWRKLCCSFFECV
jgi:hypothetical protein